MLLPDTTAGTITDPGTQPDLAKMLKMIMAQLTSLGNCLYLQGKTLARHAQLLDDAEVSTAPSTILPSQNTGAVSGAVHGSGTNGGAGGADEGSFRQPHFCPATTTMPFASPSTSPRSTFHATTVSPIRFHCSTVVSLTSGAHGHWRPSKSGWHPCIWTVSPPSGTTPSSASMASCHGLASLSSSISASGHLSAPTLSAN
jgi:hypothetical protein